ncbi:MAG: glycosyltransferase [Pseudomonadota bacterium]
MRILHCYRTYFPDPQGGGQEAIRQIALSTQAEGFTNTIFALSPQPTPAVINRTEGTVVRSLSWAAPASCDLGTLRGIRQFRLLVRQADILHYHFPWPFADLLHYCRGIDRPSVMTYHSDVVRQRWLGYAYRPLMQWMLHAMDIVAPTSEAYAASSPMLRRHVDASRLKVIPLGIFERSYDEAVSAAAAISIGERFGLERNQYFLSLGVLRYYKGLHTLIEAARDVRLPVVIAGQGPMRQALENAARQLPMGRVHFLGQVTDAEKMALIAGCRAFILPSHLRSEAFGMVLVESAMMGRPMVSCEIGTGTTYVNAHGETGLTIEPQNPEVMAAAMNRLGNDDEFTANCGRRARVRYEQLFSGGALGKGYATAYRQVTS